MGAASGLGSELLGSVGPLTAPFFLAYGLTRAAYIGTEAAAALTMHLTKIAAYGAGDLLTGKVLLYGAALTPPRWPVPGSARSWSGGPATGCSSGSSKPVWSPPVCSFSLASERPGAAVSTGRRCRSVR